jgi:hypothetical protein
MTMAKNSALVIGLLGLNVQSSYHFNIPLSANSSISSLAKLESISLNLFVEPIVDATNDLSERESEPEPVRFEVVVTTVVQVFSLGIDTDQPPPPPPPPPPPLQAGAASVVDANDQTVFQFADSTAVTVVLLAEEFVSFSCTVFQLEMVQFEANMPQLIDTNQLETAISAQVFRPVTVFDSEVSIALRALHEIEENDSASGTLSTTSVGAKNDR